MDCRGSILERFLIEFSGSLSTGSGADYLDLGWNMLYAADVVLTDMLDKWPTESLQRITLADADADADADWPLGRYASPVALTSCGVSVAGEVVRLAAWGSASQTWHGGVECLVRRLVGEADSTELAKFATL